MPLRDETILVQGKPVTIKTGSVLDLPEEAQRKLAAEEGLSAEDWRAGVIKRNKEAKALRAEIDANPVRFEDLTPEEQEAARRFQARVDDEVLTNAVLSRRAQEQANAR